MSNNHGKYQKNNGIFGLGWWPLIALGIVCIVVIVLLVVFLVKLRDGDEVQTVNPTDGIMQFETTVPTSDVPAESENETQEITETTEPEDEETEPTETENKSNQGTNSNKNNNNTNKNNNNKNNNNNNNKNNNNTNKNNNTNSDKNNGTATKPTEPEKTVIELPYTIPDSDLVIQRIAGYDGIYLEDGSDADVSGVAMMLLTNTGFEAVEYANITLYYGTETLTFKVSALPAGGRVIVQALNREGMASGDIVDCDVEIAPRATLEMSESQVSVVDNGNNSLTITNLTDKDIVTVRVFYKYYMAEENAYVGGITYTAKISNLKAGESITVTPAHYSSDASTVVMVRTYDTDA